MEHLENVSFIHDFTSRFMNPMRLTFKQNDETRNFDISLAHCSVATLLYHRQFNQFLVVRQFRPAVYVGRVTKLPENVGKSLDQIDWPKFDAEYGYTLELCAGLVDKDIPLVDIAREEIMEECGYAVAAENMKYLSTYIVDADETGSIQHLFYAEIDESLKISEGGGNIAENEVITKIFISIDKARSYIHNPESQGPPGALYALLRWFSGTINTEEKPSSNWSPEVGKPMTDVEFTRNCLTNRFKPVRMFYTLKPITRSWDLSPCNDSVSVFVYNKQTKNIMFVQRFRPAALIGRTAHDPSNKGKSLESIDWRDVDQKLGYTLEMCGTHLLKHGTEDMKVFECLNNKLGYRPKKVEYVTSFIIGISQSGDRQKIFYTEVTEDDKLSDFSGFPDVKTVSIPVSQISSILGQKEPIAPPGIHYMIQWFMNKHNITS